MHSCIVKHLDDHIWISFVVQLSDSHIDTTGHIVGEEGRERGGRGGKRREGNKGEEGEGEEGEEGGEGKERKERREGGRVHQ